VASKHSSNLQVDYLVNNKPLKCKGEFRLEALYLVKNREVEDCLDNNHKTSNNRVILVKEACSVK